MWWYVQDFVKSAWRNEDARDTVKVLFGAALLVGVLVGAVLGIAWVAHLLFGVATWLGVVGLVVSCSVMAVVVIGALIEAGDRF